MPDYSQASDRHKRRHGCRRHRTGMEAEFRMSTRINTNIEALNAQRNLTATAGRYASSVEKLSSGLRINRAADDAAGLAISEKLQAQVGGLNQAQRNAQDGVSMVQTAEGALTEVHSMLHRIRELAVEAANSTLGTADAASVNLEITALQAEINRIAARTTFNGQNLLTGALSVGQSGGSLGVGTALSTGANATVAAVDVSGARASTTYTFTAQGDKLTLSDGTGNSQQVTLSAIGATGTETINFGAMGVKLTVVGDAAKTAADLATDLATVGASPVVVAIGGATGADLVDGDVISVTDATPVVAGGGVGYHPAGLDLDGGASPVTATASAGVAQGTLVLAVDATGNITSNSLGGETFTGNMDPVLAQSRDSVVTLTGSRGNTVTLNYRQTPNPFSPTMSVESADMSGASFDFVAGAGSATVSGLTAAPSATAGTYSFTSSGAGSLTLTGPGGPITVAVGDMGANGSQTLTFGDISFTLTADANGYSAESIVSNLLQPANDTIVVTSSGGGAAGTITTGGNSGAVFQIGANEGDTMSASFANAQTAAYTGFDAAITAFGTSPTNATAGALITATDAAISLISSIRAGFGATENRLTHTVAAIGVASENLNASQSRIRDLDVAAEMVTFTKNQILQQAGTSILAQANSAPQNILTLLR